MARLYRLLVPRVDISEDVHAFAAFLTPYRELNDCDLILDFSTTGFLSPPAISLLAAVRASLGLRGVAVSLNLTGTRETLRKYLERVGFMGDPMTPHADYAIPLQQFPTLDSAAIGDYLLNRWISKSPLTPDARKYVASAVGELFINVFNHARSPIGLFTCGQYFPNLHDLKLVIVDLGISIPESVRIRFLRNRGFFRPEDALEWAFKSGNSSLATSRGLGLKIIEDLIVKNGGSLRISFRRCFRTARDTSVIR